MQDYLLNMLQVTYTIVLPIVLTLVINKKKDKTKTDDNKRQADMLTLRLNLIMLHDQYVPTGEISRYAYETFEEIWELYHNGYNGNHLTERFHQEVQKLEIKL